MFGSGVDSVNGSELVAVKLFIAYPTPNLLKGDSMRDRVVSVVGCALIALGIVNAAARPFVVAQESNKASKSEKGDGVKKAARSGDRLPANYAKIGVSDEQRKKIYEIQGKYDKDIAALQKQIAELRSKESAEVEAVLTADQKKALQAANDESKKKAAEKKKAGEKGSEKSEKSGT